MTGAIFVAAITVALAVLSGRRLQRWHHQRQRLQRPGFSAANPMHVSRFDGIDAFINAQRCVCGARLKSVAEGSTQGIAPRTPTGTGAVGATQGVLQEASAAGRVVKTECSRCETEDYFYFELPGTLH